MSGNKPGNCDPIDLSQEGDFTLGALRVSPSTREVMRASARESLEPRVMQVLVALHQAGGKVVSRDLLIARCWEGRIVGEDAITRAIGRLRRLSEADGGASFTVETVTRVGFRLTPNDAPEPGAKTPSDTQTLLAQPPPAQASAPLRWVLAAVTVVLLVGGMAAFLWRPLVAPSRWTVDNSRNFIFGLALDDYPAFSTNGTMLAYTSGADGGARQIFVRNLAGGEAVKLTNDGYDDVSPTWSSDGARLAYVAIKEGEPCHFMVATFPAGAAHEVGRCRAASSSGLAWQPGTSLLYFSEPGGLKGDVLYRLDLDSGAVTAMTREPALRDYITGLSCSPDGKFLAYVVHGDTIVIRNLAARESQDSEKPLGLIATRGAWSSWLAWSNDSQTVLATVNGGAGGSQIMAFPMDSSPPYRVYATQLNIGHIAVAGNMLAMENDTSRSNIALAAASPSTAPDIIDPASGQTWSPTFAPDGTLAFLSNRSGNNAIWILKRGATAPAQLTDLGFTPAYRIRYSPDGARLAMAIETTGSLVVKVLTAGGATLTTFDMPSLGLGLPTWTPDGKALFLFDRGPKQTFQIDVDNPAKRFAFAAPHWVGITLYHGGAYAKRADKNGIWRIDGKTPVLITDKYPAYHDPPLVFRDDAVLLTHFDGGVARFFAQPLEGGPEKFVAYAPGLTNSWDNQSTVTVNPRTDEIYYSVRTAHETGIDLLTLAKK